MRQTNVMKMAKISEIGCASHTPSNPINRGKIKMSGTNKISCLNKLNTMARRAFPIDWKKFDPIIETETNVNMNK